MGEDGRVGLRLVPRFSESFMKRLRIQPAAKYIVERERMAIMERPSSCSPSEPRTTWIVIAPKRADVLEGLR